MTLQPIRTEQEYDQVMDWIDEQFDQKVQPGTNEANELRIALLFVKAYEDEHYPML